MAVIDPVEWFYDSSTYWKQYGLVNLAGKYAVVKATGFSRTATGRDEFEVITDYVDRPTAIGFLKLLKELK